MLMEWLFCFKYLKRIVLFRYDSLAFEILKRIVFSEFSLQGIGK
jgi:hypothetical protein